MSGQATVLEYATPARRRRLREVVAPRHIAWAAGILAAASLIAPLDIGSGRVVVNPVRVLGCAAAVGCVILYAMLRLWQDRSEGAVRTWVFGGCLIVCTAAFSYAHWSRWGFTHKPRLSLQHDYWRAWLAFAVALLAAMTVSAVSRIRCRRAATAPRVKWGRSGA